MRLGLTALDALARGPELLERIAALKVMQATSDAALAEALTARCDAETKVDWWRGKADRLAELEARERRVREACEDVHRQCAQAQYDPEVMSVAGFADDVRAILDGKVASPVPVLPTITLDATKAGTIAEEAPERQWMVMQDPDGSWAAWSCGAHEGYRLHNDKCGLTREQAEDEGRASGLRPFDGKVTP
jgi:hypothetical protein